jgi:hypothetical protein
MFVYASFLLTYDPNSIFQEWLQTVSNFKVMPETGIVPTEPLVTAPATVSALLRNGVYVREFAACYYRGSLVGKCAIVVNPSAASVSLSLGYMHSVVLQGSDALDGGTVQFAGPAVTQLAPLSASILF